MSSQNFTINSQKHPIISNWKPFEEYNSTDPKLKAEKLVELGINVSDPAILGILTKINFQN